MRIGGIEGVRLDLKRDRDTRFGPSGLPEPDAFGINGGAGARAWITVLRVQGHVVVMVGTLGPENVTRDFQGAVLGLEPIIDSITWG